MTVSGKHAHSEFIHIHTVNILFAYTAVALLTRIHTASPVLFSIAGDVFLLREFVGHEQTCLYSVTCLGGTRYRSRCFLYSIAEGDILLLLAVFLLWQVICQAVSSVTAILLVLPFLPNYPMPNALKALKWYGIHGYRNVITLC